MLRWSVAGRSSSGGNAPVVGHRSARMESLTGASATRRLLGISAKYGQKGVGQISRIPKD
eukprot:867414-Prorocentrum_minimum.AAC.1